MTIRIAVVGLGKIARDQHLPTIAANGDYQLAAVVSRRGLTEGGAPVFADIGELIASGVAVDAVSLCTPPEVHFDCAREAMRAGIDVMLEKPPTMTLAEFAELRHIAGETGRTLFATWHSRFNAASEKLRDHLAGRTVSSLAITWKEDVRRWHPGQAWIWEKGGFGVFDPGINALSILTMIMPSAVFVKEAVLKIPINRGQPIAADLVFRSATGDADLTAEFDWRHTGLQTWRIDLATEDGETIVLDGGGRELTIGGAPVASHGDDEYAGIYRRFAELVAARESDIDPAPLRLVADAFMLGRRDIVEAFDD